MSVGIRMALNSLLGICLQAAAADGVLPYRIVDTGQTRCFDNAREIPFPAKGAPFDGQDACFGRAFGHMGPVGRKGRVDVHGAGAQRSDFKSGDPAQWPEGRGPQGDEVRVLNYVRCVCGGDAVRKSGE